MESDGVFNMYQETFTTHNIYYNLSIGNGGSGTFTSAYKVRPYNTIVLEQKGG